VLPWALGEERLDGHALEVGSGSGAMAAALLDKFPALHLTATDVVKPGGRVIGCDMVYSRVLDWSGRTFGSGVERLIRPSEFTQQVA
jgi:hypothetical protein